MLATLQIKKPRILAVLPKEIPSTDCNKKTIQSENGIFDKFLRINSILLFHIS